MDVALDWIDQVQDHVSDLPAAEILALPADDKEAFAWYDMAVGQRSYRLAYLTDLAGRDPGISDETFGRMLDSVYFHARLLIEPSFFRAHSNHGLYQALGLAATTRRFAWLAGMRGYAKIAERQLQQIIESQFFDEGTHREHTPAYHHMVLGSLVNASRGGLLSTRTRADLRKAETALSWMVMPDGALAPFGDGDPAPLGSTAGYENDGFVHLLTKGSKGPPPHRGVRHYPESGYGFARTYDPATQGCADASYLAQMSAFHSRVHKHADHMTFVWSEGQLPILTDPGRFGYEGRTKKGDGLWEQGFWYADPRRVYIESTRAHNAVEIDGRSYRRARNDAFGPALRQAEQQGPLVVFHSDAAYANARVRQRRTLILWPGKFLLCLDAMFGKRDHEYRQWFLLAPQWHAAAADGVVSATADGATLCVTELLGGAELSPVFTGAEDPMQGWFSPSARELVPSPSFHYRRDGKIAIFASLFSLEGEAEVLPATRVNAGLSRGVFAWRSAGGERVVRYERVDDRVTTDVA
ncbi:MAG: heparinase II/III family protein [Sphingomonas sp.]